MILGKKIKRTEYLYLLLIQTHLIRVKNYYQTQDKKIYMVTLYTIVKLLELFEMWKLSECDSPKI